MVTFLWINKNGETINKIFSVTYNFITTKAELSFLEVAKKMIQSWSSGAWSEEVKEERQRKVTAAALEF